MFGYKTKKPTAQQLAAQYGPSWRAEVSSSDGEWKPLQDWESKYEPPQPSKAPSKAESYMAAKAKQVLANKMKKSVSNKIITIALESSSKVLTLAEEEANNAAAKGTDKSANDNNDDAPNNDNKAKQAWDTLSKLLNNTNAIVLTYRFQSHDPIKFTYLRKVASNAIADVLHSIFESLEQEGEHLDEIRANLNSLLESQKNNVHNFVETSLDEALQEAAANAEASTANKLAKAKKQLAEAATKGAASLDGAVMAENEMDPKTREEIEELENQIKMKHEDIKDESVSMLSDCIKLMVLKNLDKLATLLEYALNKMFDTAEELYKTQTELNKSQQELRVFQVVEKSFSDFKHRVSYEVQRAVTVLEAVMDDSGGDDS